MYHLYTYTLGTKTVLAIQGDLITSTFPHSLYETWLLLWCSHRELSPGVGEDRPSGLPPELLLLYF